MVNGNTLTNTRLEVPNTGTGITKMIYGNASNDKPPSLSPARLAINWKVPIPSLRFNNQQLEQDREKITMKSQIDTSEYTKSHSNIVDLTKKFFQPSGIVKSYRDVSEQHLAKYAVTQLVNSFGKLVRHGFNINLEPDSESIATNIEETTTVYKNVCATLVFERKGRVKLECLITAIQLEYSYEVSMASLTGEGLSMLETTFSQMLEKCNFYHGKTLRYGDRQVEFIPIPTTLMEDAVLAPETVDEISLNVLQFLTNPKMNCITKKRGMLFYGPPGTGKTTTIKAMFRELSAKGVTCIYLTDSAFRENSVENVFAFINKYLAPALVVFEDIDLIAPDRRESGGRLLGSLLSALNGVEEQQKPIAIVATTNRVEVLDAAVTRPCRFDRRIKIDYPSEKEMNKIFHKISGFKAPEGCFSSSSVRLTGAHIEEIYRTSALLSVQSSRKIQDCLEEAVAQVKKHFMIVSPKAIGFSEVLDNEGVDDIIEADSKPVGSCGVRLRR